MEWRKLNSNSDHIRIKLEGRRGNIRFVVLGKYYTALRIQVSDATQDEYTVLDRHSVDSMRVAKEWCEAWSWQDCKAREMAQAEEDIQVKRRELQHALDNRDSVAAWVDPDA